MSDYFTRFCDGSELRAIDGADGSPAKISGYAAVFNSVSNDLGGFKEKILPGAFRDAISSADDVLALVEHDPKMVVGRRSRGTLEMKEDGKGLFVEITPPNTSVGRDVLENVRRGDIKGMSFRFRRPKDSWQRQGGDNLRSLHSIGKLIEVTLTAVPVYEATTAEIRSQIQHLEHDNRRARLRLAEIK